MKLTESVVVPVPPERVFPFVDDLSRYPSWMGIVHRADALGDGRWRVELRGRVGPLARSKRLVMVRTSNDPPHGVRFERREDDGRSHAAWTLAVTIGAVAEGSEVVVHLEYAGRLWSSVIERVLREQIEISKTRLVELVSA